MSPFAANADAPLGEVTIHREGRMGFTGPDAKILVISVNGPIVEERSSSVTRPSIVKRMLDMADQDGRIRAVLLRLDSPGGTVTDSDMIHHMLLEYSRKRNIPIYSQVEGMAASGAYYIAMSSHFIQARPTALVGSIGVIMQSFSLSSLIEKAGIRYRSIQSSPEKDMLSPFREMRPEEKAFLQNQVMEAYNRFLAIVLDGRKNKISEEKLRAIANGSVYSANQSMESGLVDSIGYMDDMIQLIRQKERLTDFAVVTYSQGPAPKTLLDVYAESEPLQAFLGHFRSGLFYIWEGGM